MRPQFAMYNVGCTWIRVAVEELSTRSVLKVVDMTG